MPLIKQTLIIDLITTFWIVAIFMTLFFFLPIKAFCNNAPKIDQSQIVGLWLRIILVIITGILGLSYLHLLNWLTLAFLYGSCLIFNYLESSDWQVKYYQQIIESKIFNLVDILDQGLSFKDLIKATWNSCQKIKQRFTDYLENLVIRQGIFFVVILTVVLGFALLLRWEHPLLELRFSDADRYSVLLITRQILAGNYPEINYLPLFPALAAILSLLSSIDAMQAIRFLSPILGIIMVFSVGYLVRVLTNNAASALVSMFALGVYLFTWEQGIDAGLPEWFTRIIDSLNGSLIRQWTGNELELGAIFVLLSLGYYFDTDKQLNNTTTFKINIVCSIILVSMSAPPMLILLAIASVGLIGGKRLTLTAITLSWIILAVFAAMTQGQLLWTQSFLLTLPVPLSLLAGLLFNALSEILKLRSNKWAETFCLTLILSLSINFLLPWTPSLTYLEYDMAARKSLELNNLFPSQSWTLAAPTEQLAEIYGFGWYEDLALFVEKYADKVSKPEFKFPVSGTDLFIFVEKIPFVTFATEPSALPNSILSDRTYRYYRSSAGRASLEFEALQMCEAYRLNHHDSKIYYEDRELRIYHFRTSENYP